MGKEGVDLALPNEAVPFVTKSAVAQARQRVCEAPLAWLFERTAWAVDHAGRGTPYLQGIESVGDGRHLTAHGRQPGQS
ncbi:hypothetical protein BZL54_02715 [Burkholderia ubonensis subsp. mesacidophila]|uniref:Transposase IS4 N-terminal domain-containing protein n=1 Tax=Burkholderia ubonensis subsp. mesacidophila TaxID=265293 RepID=A0A2A4FNJ2_9BURK|nr:hypothetical protein BZL54_02715 [Burkholderia ubonensis subsp. mesacidophila]